MSSSLAQPAWYLDAWTTRSYIAILATRWRSSKGHISCKLHAIRLVKSPQSSEAGHDSGKQSFTLRESTSFRACGRTCFYEPSPAALIWAARKLYPRYSRKAPTQKILAVSISSRRLLLISVPLHFLRCHRPIRSSLGAPKPK